MRLRSRLKSSETSGPKPSFFASNVSSSQFVVYNFVVVAVRADPKPNDPIRSSDAHSAVMQPHAHRPVAASLLEVEGWVSRICLQHFKRFVGLFSYLDLKQVVASPEVGRGVVVHSFVDRPDA